MPQTETDVLVLETRIEARPELVFPFLTDQRTLKNLLREVKRRAIVDALEKNKQNKTKAAKALGISRQGLIKMLKEIHISEELSKK